jgi:hypothetical protein
MHHRVADLDNAPFFDLKVHGSNLGKREFFSSFIIF